MKLTQIQIDSNAPIVREGSGLDAIPVSWSPSVTVFGTEFNHLQLCRIEIDLEKIPAGSKTIVVNLVGRPPSPNPMEVTLVRSPNKPLVATEIMHHNVPSPQSPFMGHDPMYWAVPEHVPRIALNLELRGFKVKVITPQLVQIIDHDEPKRGVCIEVNDESWATERYMPLSRHLLMPVHAPGFLRPTIIQKLKDLGFPVELIKAPGEQCP